jgi:release factor glutamine methyltransferase
MSARAAARDARLILERAGVPDPAFEAEYLARVAGSLTRAAYFADTPLPQGALDTYDALIGRRARREPTAYLTGTREFFGLDFRVTPDVLIPRPETELLVEAAIEALDALPKGAVAADIGTGSGCIAVSIAHARRNATVLASDASDAALAVARQNARRHNAPVRFLRGDLAGAIGHADVVVANLPYIPSGDIAGLEPELRDWEPRLALDGGNDGLSLIRPLIADCASRLRPRVLALEVAMGQAREVAAIAAETGARAEIRLDLAGIERVVLARWP